MAETGDKWQVYFDRLVGLARKKLRALPPQVLKNEEDIACSAIKSFCRGLERNGLKFSEQEDFDLWPLLATIAARKCADLVVYLTAKKRDPAMLAPAEIDEITCDEPGPASAAQQEESRQHLLNVLKDQRLRQIAEWKMEGYTNAEISEKLDCSKKTVEREIKLIKLQWEQHVQRIWGKADAV
jgi:DNA-directed RNA polymerase specialized sigma24 family protein